LAWTVEIEAAALKELKSLDHAARLSIHRFLKERIATDDDPRRFGEPLRKNLSGLWKYPVGAYLVICSKHRPIKVRFAHQIHAQILLENSH